MIDEKTIELANEWCKRHKLCKGCGEVCAVPIEMVRNNDKFFEWSEKKMKRIAKLQKERQNENEASKLH